MLMFCFAWIDYNDYHWFKNRKGIVKKNNDKSQPLFPEPHQKWYARSNDCPNVLFIWSACFWSLHSTMCHLMERIRIIAYYLEILPEFSINFFDTYQTWILNCHSIAEISGNDMGFGLIWVPHAVKRSLVDFQMVFFNYEFSAIYANCW